MAILQRGVSCALAGSRLKNPKFAELNGELDVLHVAIVMLEPMEDLLQLCERLRHCDFERRFRCVAGAFLGQGLRRANSGDHIFALRVGQVLAENFVLARRRIAREGNTGCGIVSEVAEDHRLHGDCRAPVVRNIV